jgi:hypothetical protein
MLTLLLAATLGQYRSCQHAASYAARAYGYGYAAPAYNYGYARPQAYFAPVAQYDQYRTELVGDQQRAAQYAAARLQADTALVNALQGVSGEIGKFRAQVAQSTAQPPPQPPQLAPQPLPPPPPVFQQPAQQPPPQASPQYPQATPQQFQQPTIPDKTTPPVPGKSPGDFGQVPPIPSDQPPPIPQPQPGFSQPQIQPGFNTQPQPPQSSLGGPPSQFQQAAVTILQNRCGKCHTGNGASGNFRIFDAPGQLAQLTQDVRAKIDDVAYSGKIVKVDPGTGGVEELPMPPSGKVLDTTEYSTLRAFFNEQREAIALASQRSGGAR